MTFEVRGISADRALRAHVDQALTSALARLAVRAVAVKVTFTDDNGPKGGPAARCSLSVQGPRRSLVRAEAVATTNRLAFDGGLARLTRALQRGRQRVRDTRRRPPAQG